MNQMFAVFFDHPIRLRRDKTRADHAFAAMDAGARQRYSCGAGAKGHRFYDWAWIQTDDHQDDHQGGQQGGQQGGHGWVLARRSIPVSLPELVWGAGARWSVEACFQAAKNEVGLDHYQVRKHTAWYRHITLAMVAHAHLVFLAARRPPDPGDRHNHRHGEDLDDLATQGATTAGTIALLPAGRGRSGRADPAHRQRNPPHTRPPASALAPRPTPSALVTLATTPPSPRPRMPLPAATTPHRPLNAAGVIDPNRITGVRLGRVRRP
nr:hypothetical protein GCM10010200_009230 [Actinomadura rugatobispora]